MFTKEERSTFPYWFAHWCAFQLVALNLRAWKFKYLFHDMEKPWLKLFLPYQKVQTFHRHHNRHHMEYRPFSKTDWEAMVIDWECSRYTKVACELNARGEMERYIKSHPEDEKVLRENMEPVLRKFGL